MTNLRLPDQAKPDHEHGCPRFGGFAEMENEDCTCGAGNPLLDEEMRARVFDPPLQDLADAIDGAPITVHDDTWDDELTEWSHHGRGGSEGTGVILSLLLAGMVVGAVAWWWLT